MPIIDSLNLVNVVTEDADKLTAMADHVLSGYFFIGKQKYMVVGNIPIHDIITDTTLLGSERHLVKRGYNPQDYYVIAESVQDQTPATAAANEILIDRTAWVNGIKITGTMPDNSAVSHKLMAGESYTVPIGYHNGQGTVTSETLAAQTPGDTTVGDVRDGKVFWVGGNKLTGTMPVIAPTEVRLQQGQSYTIPAGSHSGTGTVVAEALGSQTPGTATADDIIEGKTAWVDGSRLVGTIPQIASQEHILPVNGTYNIPKGYHNGRGSVKQDIPVQNAFTITPSFEDQVVKVDGKYMNGDILVTGLNALNYRNIDNNAEYLINSTGLTVSYNGSAATVDCGKLTVDNWHDQATDNIYMVEVYDNSIASAPVKLLNGVIFINNLAPNPVEGSNILTSRYVSADNPSQKAIMSFKVSMEEGTNAHKFTFEIKADSTSTTLSPDISSINVKIKEIMGLRRYGDEHDVN